MSVSTEESLPEHVSNAFSFSYLDVTESCPSNGTGLNPIFSDSAEEVVEHEELVQLALAKQEHPDRIYGLQQTTSFEAALYSPSKRHCRADGRPMLVGETVRFTPFKQFGEPLLFPFLILEAKSAMGEDFETIQKQTAFPIRTLLQIQEDLRSECKDQVTWQGGPLLWFLSNRGEDWRVAACFVDMTDGQTSHVSPSIPYALRSQVSLTCDQRIFNLWNGDVSSKDGALQLRLIIDYISDWARHIYRPAILRPLQSLSGGNPGDTISFADSINTLSANPPPGTLANRKQFATLSDEAVSSTLRDAPAVSILPEGSYATYLVRIDVIQRYLPRHLAIQVARAFHHARCKRKKGV